MHIQTPLSNDTIRSLRAGMNVLISGVIYTARDAAHALICSALENGGEPPFNFDGSVIFYAGPSPAPPGRAVGAIGPTTSSRMDKFAPFLIERGLKVMLGKGERSEAVLEAIRKHTGCYLTAIGGAAALLSESVLSAKAICYHELGAEAVWELCVKDFPAIVTYDYLGNCLYGSSSDIPAKVI